jgi:hypothetical protein
VVYEPLMMDGNMTYGLGVFFFFLRERYVSVTAFVRLASKQKP